MKTGTALLLTSESPLSTQLGQRKKEGRWKYDEVYGAKTSLSEMCSPKCWSKIRLGKKDGQKERRNQGCWMAMSILSQNSASNTTCLCLSCLSAYIHHWQWSQRQAWIFLEQWCKLLASHPPLATSVPLSSVSCLVPLFQTPLLVFI